MRSVITIMFCCLASVIQAQSVNYDNIKVLQKQSLTYIFNSPEDLERTQTLNSALEVKVKVKDLPCALKAMVNFDDPGNTETFREKISLRFANSNSTNVFVPISEIALDESPRDILLQPMAGQGTQHYSYYFDVILYPPTTFGAGTNNTFSITFIMTNP